MYPRICLARVLFGDYTGVTAKLYEKGLSLGVVWLQFSYIEIYPGYVLVYQIIAKLFWGMV